MRRTLFGIGSLAAFSLMMVGCTDAPTDRMGERSADPAPAASPTTPPSESPAVTSPASPPAADSPASPGGGVSR